MRDAFSFPYTRKDAQRYISKATGHTPDLLLAIGVNGEAVGGMGIHLLDDVKHRTAEIGHWISGSLWRKGYVTDAVRSVVPVAFERYDIVRLQVGIFSSNPDSMRVPEKYGFSPESVHRNAFSKNGIILDEVKYVHFG